MPNTKLIEEKVEAFRREFVEKDGFMLARLQQPTDFLIDWLRQAFTDLLTQQHLADIAVVEAFLPPSAKDNNFPDDFTRGYASGVGDVVAALRSHHQGETLSE